MIPVKVITPLDHNPDLKFIPVRKCLEDLYPSGFKIYNLCSEHKSFQRAKDVDGKILHWRHRRTIFQNLFLSF